MDGPERLPPNDDTAEKALLGCMMLSRGAALEALHIIPPESENAFYSTQHQTIFRMVCQLVDREVPIDLVTCRDQLIRKNALKAAGGVQYLIDCAHSVPSPTNVAHYAHIVLEHWQRRVIIKWTGQLDQHAHDMASNIKGRWEMYQRRMNDAFLNGNGEYNIDKIIQEAKNEALTHENLYETTGLNQFDEEYGGIPVGGVSVVGAHSSHGKTTLALNMALNMAMRGSKAVIFSLETNKAILATNIVANLSRYYAPDLRHRRMDPEQIEAAFEMVYRMIDGECLQIFDRFTTVNSILAEMRHQMQNLGVRTFFVDYLQLVKPTESRYSRHEEVSQVSRAFKWFALENRATVVLLSQLGRPPDKAKPRKPTLWDLKESGSIENDADLVLLLWYPYKISGKTTDKYQIEMQVAKCKQGATRIGDDAYVFTYEPGQFRIGTAHEEET